MNTCPFLLRLKREGSPWPLKGMIHTQWCRTVTFYFLNPATTHCQQPSKVSPALYFSTVVRVVQKHGFCEICVLAAGGSVSVMSRL